MQYTDPAHVHAPKVVNGETYTYGDGLLVKKEVDGQATVYVDQHYERDETTGQETKYYFFGGQRVAMQQGGEVYFVHTDHLGSTSIMSDLAGNTVGDAVRYYPYGVARAGTPGALPTDYAFTGQRHEEPLGGLYHMGARFYDPALGRWLSADPLVPDLATPHSLNRYGYTLNNPLKYRDPNGHFVVASVGAFLAFKGVKAAGGALVTGGTYLWNARRTGTFDWKDFLVTAGTGAAATTLVGKAAIAGTAVKRTVMRGVGTNMFVSSEKHLIGNLLGGETFDRRDYIMDVGFSGAEGGISDWLGGHKVQKALALGGLAWAEFRVRARANDEPIEHGEAIKVGLGEGTKIFIIDWPKEYLVSHGYDDKFREWLGSIRSD